MSTSLLYHGWGLRGHTHRRTDFVDGCIVFTAEPSTDDLRCSGCGGREVRREGGVRRRWRTTPIGGKPVFVDTNVPRVWCASCGKTRQVEIGFAPPRARYTRAFERYALELSASMTIQDAAHHLGVSWDVVKDIQKRHLERRFKRIRLKDLTQIAIDEISVGKGHRYLTVVLDLLSGAVVFIGEGKGADALEPFWRKLRASGGGPRAPASRRPPAT